MILLAIKLVFVLACLIYASYTDLKTRKVPNKLWLVMLAPLPFFIAFENIAFISLLISFLCCAAFAYLFFAMHFWGAADAKAVMLLSLYFPFFVYSLPLIIWAVYTASIASVIIHWKDLIHFDLRNAHPFMPMLTIGFVFAAILLIA